MPYIISINTNYWENNIPGWNGFTPEQQKAAREAELNSIDEKIRSSKNIVCGRWIDPMSRREMVDIKITPYNV